jgi:hypothetical protein
MKRHWFLLIGVLLGTVVISGILAILPYPQVVHDVPADEMGGVMATNFIAVGIQLDGAILVLLGLKGYKTAFKKVYYFIAGGMVAMALNTAVFWAISMTEGFNVPLLPLAMGMVSLVLFYLGLIRFAKLLGLSGQFSTLIVLTVLAALINSWLWFLPQDARHSTPLWSDLDNVATSITVVFAVASAITAWRINQQASRRYSSTVMSLCWALALLSVFYANSLVSHFVQEPVAINTILTLSGLFGSMIFFLRAAYCLLKSTYEVVAPSESRAATIIDVNVYLASLVSTPRAVEPILDPMRVVTATHKTSDAFAARDEAILRKVCEELKTYLVTKEPLRSFNAQELNELLRLKFGDNWTT